MAIVKKIRKVSKENNSNSTTLMDYAFNKNGLSIWTYATDDPNGERGSKQNLLFELDKVYELKKIIEQYLDDVN